MWSQWPIARVQWGGNRDRKKNFGQKANIGRRHWTTLFIINIWDLNLVEEVCIPRFERILFWLLILLYDYISHCLTYTFRSGGERATVAPAVLAVSFLFAFVLFRLINMRVAIQNWIGFPEAVSHVWSHYTPKFPKSIINLSLDKS